MIITLLRKPLEGTVVDNTLKHGCGGINIDATRIAAEGETISNHSRGSDSAKSKGKYGDSKAQETHQTEGQKLGRFPANFILIHKEKCELKGTKKVKSNPGGGKTKSSIGGQSAYGGGKERVWKNHADEDGKETILDWDCVEDCPVQELDRQSGHQKSGVAGSKSRAWGVEGKEDILFREGWKAYGSEGYKDEGGASRFFKQFKTEDDQ